MYKSSEVAYCSNLLNSMGNPQRMKFLKSSNLMINERKIISYRHIYGYSTQEIADKLGVEVNSYQKIYKRLMKKLYKWCSQGPYDNKYSFYPV